jgi:2,3-bisphosphoglycerate-dependent phosphoglycerate mutase
MVLKKGNRMKQLYFVRHGLSEFNKEKKWAGSTDTPLTLEGCKQAEEAGRFAKAQGLAFDLILSSPLRRAHDTATHIATHTGYPHWDIMLKDFLKERNFGTLEGTSILRSVSAKYLVNEAAIDAYEGVEPFASLQKRADEAYAYLQSLTHDRILVVAHGAFGRALYRAVHGLPPTKRVRRYKNAKIIQLQ